MNTLHTRGFFALVIGAISASACLSEDPPPPLPTIEWHTVDVPGGSVQVALVRPVEEGTRDHPVVFALPWGAGTPELTAAFVRRYWHLQPRSRGFYVVAPAIRGSSLETEADAVIPALFDWMSSELSADLDNVALVGASNGGRGVFFAAISQPRRFHALLAIPGAYGGEAAELAPLAGTPIRLAVGELDTDWRRAVLRTSESLKSLGIDAQVNVLDGQGHVLELPDAGLMDWIEAALAR